MNLSSSKCIVGKAALWLFLMMTIFNLSASAQNRTVKGVVTDATTQEPLMGASVMMEDGKVGAVTDLDGNFSITVAPGVKKLKVSYIGFVDKTVAVTDGVINVVMEPDDRQLGEVVVVGYGTARKSDLTGSVSTINSKDFNKGSISSAEELINGKVSGVQITSNSGSTTAGSTIRVRGGASLNASNDPLIVVDGVPLELGGIAGADNNFLSLINPQDIESMTVLKDASSTAIYGSRASNGVIIITTKKGSDAKPKIQFTTTNTLQTRANTIEVLTADEFRSLINANGTDAQKALLGNANTDWYDEVYRTSFSTDNNLSISGSLVKGLPFRVSLGYSDQNGIVRKDQAERYTGNIVLSPSFFEDHLKLTVNAKGTISKNYFNNSNAIWAAATFNPTLPVYTDYSANTGAGQYTGKYTESLDASGKPITAGSGQRNPRGLVDQYDASSTVKRFIGNFDVDYKVHFFPDLKLHATVGTDISSGKGSEYIPEYAASDFTNGGKNYHYGPQKNTNNLLTLYANYGKYFEEAKSNVDVTVGYDWQHWKSTKPASISYNIAGDQLNTYKEEDYRHTLLSYYGRVNYSYDGRYLLTATIRRDGSSRFGKDYRWGTFPSVGLGWTLTQEKFLQDQKVLSNLKLRASYGVTGQQEVGGNYNYLPVYTSGSNGAEAYINGQWIYTYRPEAYVSNLKWETTTSWNYGFDFGFLDNRISGSFDFYTRKTKDLIATIPAAAGTQFGKTITTNVGNVDSHGIEVTLNATPIKSKDWEWNLSYNFTWQKMTVKNLSKVASSEVTNMTTGPAVKDSETVQVLTEGYTPNMFYVYHQLYDRSGKPIEGAYADINGDGVINEKDRYRYHSPMPDYIMGLSTSLRWKQLTLGMSFRSNIGNYVYNATAMNTGAWELETWANGLQLNNLNRSYLKTGFKTRQYLSDYYVENASFLKLDNINLSYNFGQVTKWFSLTASAMVQNVFCITKYSGPDPEVANGVDSSLYPRPRTYTISLGLQF